MWKTVRTLVGKFHISFCFFMIMGSVLKNVPQKPPELNVFVEKVLL